MLAISGGAVAANSYQQQLSALATPTLSALNSPVNAFQQLLWLQSLQASVGLPNSSAVTRLRR